MAQDLARILIVDDDANIIELVAGIFEEEYEILFATNGIKALEIAASAQPDLILLDILMPEMNGFEVCRQLKGDDETMHIPVVFLTGKDCPEDETAGLKLGAVDYITKPINASILQARVKTHIALAHARKKLEVQNQELIEAARVREDVEHIMRHDLKSSITSILSSPRAILLDDNLTEEQRVFLQLMEESALRMLNMVEMSLILLKIEIKNYAVNYQPVDLIKLVKNIISESQAVAKPKKIKTRLLIEGSEQLPESPLIVMTEEILCSSMLMNLHKNALEASPHESDVLISITPGNDVTISIQNLGEVPESIRTRFFNKYVTEGKKHGTGLGTYSAKIIAEALMGTIKLDSSVPGQTTITVKFPNKPKTDFDKQAV